MQAEELLTLVARGEGLHADFKERLPSADELAKDIVCFANTDGGRILVGVADDGRLVGVGDPDAAARHVDNAAYQNCEPPVAVVQEVLDVDGRHVLVVNVPRGSQRPYRTNRGRYYVRTTSGCRDASREELARLFQAVESLYYDEGPVRLFVFDGRVDIHTPGRPPNSVTAEAMRAGVHVVRNPRLYARLADAGLVTRAGTGVRRIFRLVREATGHDPRLEVRDFEVLLSLPRPAPPPAP